MYCKKCGAEISDGAKQCSKCGYEDIAQSIETSKEDESKPVENQNSEKIVHSGAKLGIWCWLAIGACFCACITFYMGVDKMIHYNSGEFYPYEAINAYVGGDAYNYIINGTYATAYFVLTMMFVLSAIGVEIINYISKEKINKR